MFRHSTLMRSLLVILVLGLTTSAHARNGDDDDIGHEAARHLLESGRILSLETILSKIADRLPGKLIGTKLENDDGRILYDLKFLRPDGRVQELEIDAVTGDILKIEDDD